jgi:hypothetical protein
LANSAVRVEVPEIRLQPVPPQEFKMPALPEEKLVLPPVPSEPQRIERMWDGWGDGAGGWKKGWIVFPLLWLLLLVGLIFVAVRMFRRRGWGGPGWYGGPGHGPGPGNVPPYQHPYQQYPPQYGPPYPPPYPPQYGPQYGQPYQQYPPQYGQGQGGQQGQPNQGGHADNAHGDITRPEGERA